MEWAGLVAQLERDYVTDSVLLKEVGRLEGGENALPEDLLARGRQVFETVCALTADRLCRDPAVIRLVSANGPRTSEVLTVIPLLISLLPDQALKDTSIALIALLIVRMGVGTFCERYRRSSPPST